MLKIKVKSPIIKISIKGVFVNEVIADKDIFKYFIIDIFDLPENLFSLLYFIPHCLNPINEINPLKYKFLSSNFFK